MWDWLSEFRCGRDATFAPSSSSVPTLAKICMSSARCALGAMSMGLADQRWRPCIQVTAPPNGGRINGQDAYHIRRTPSVSLALGLPEASPDIASLPLVSSTPGLGGIEVSTCRIPDPPGDRVSANRAPRLPLPTCEYEVPTD